jgi:hypothetical protein
MAAKIYTTTQFRVFINKKGTIFPQYSNDGKTWLCWASKGLWVTRRSVKSAKSFIEQRVTWLGDREIAVVDGSLPSEEEQHLQQLKELLAKKQNKSFWCSLDSSEFAAFQGKINAAYNWLITNGVPDERIIQIEVEAGLY